MAKLVDESAMGMRKILTKKILHLLSPRNRQSSVKFGFMNAGKKVDHK